MQARDVSAPDTRATRRAASAGKSIIAEVREVALAEHLVRLGARLQLLEAETQLSRDRLIRLYKEVKGASPPRGMLPFSPDWFMNARPNIHSSLFHSIYRHVRARIAANEERAALRALMKSYELYLETVTLHGEEPVLSFTRAWTLPRFFDSGLLDLHACACCGGRFIVHADTVRAGFVCGLCAPALKNVRGNDKASDKAA
jgi:flagellar transcriptional activator FlhC